MIIVKKLFINIAITNLVYILSLPAMALKSDFQKPIQINSANQSLNLKKNISTFTKNVIIKQGSIDIRANQVIVTRHKVNLKKIVIEAYGTPVTFYQLQDDGKSIKGCSNKIYYETEKQLLILTGNAYLKQLDSYIQGDKITYLIPTKQIKAFSDTGKAVTTMLLSSQLQKK